MDDFITEARQELPPNDSTQPCSIEGCENERVLTFDDGTGACRSCIRRVFINEAAVELEAEGLWEFQEPQS